MSRKKRERPPPARPRGPCPAAAARRSRARGRPRGGGRSPGVRPRVPRSGHERGRDERVRERLREVEPSLVRPHAPHPREARRRVDGQAAARPLEEDAPGARPGTPRGRARGRARRSAGRGRGPGSTPSRSRSPRRPRTRPRDARGRSRPSVGRHEGDASASGEDDPTCRSQPPRLPVGRRGARDPLVEVDLRVVAEEAARLLDRERPALRPEVDAPPVERGLDARAARRSPRPRRPPTGWAAAGIRKGSTRPPVCFATRAASSVCDTYDGPQTRNASPTASSRSRASRKPGHEVVDVDGVVEGPAGPDDRVAPAGDRRGRASGTGSRPGRRWPPVGPRPPAAPARGGTRARGVSASALVAW